MTAVYLANRMAMPVQLNTVQETIVPITVALASLELGQTTAEKFQRDVPGSIPIRVRRLLVRLLIVLALSLPVASLVAVFQFIHEDLSDVLYAAAIGLVPAGLTSG